MSKIKRPVSFVISVITVICLVCGCGNSDKSEEVSAEIQKMYLKELKIQAAARFVASSESTENVSEDDNREAEEVILEPAENDDTDGKETNEDGDTNGDSDSGENNRNYEFSTEEIGLNNSWQYADSSVINWGSAVLYKRSSGWNGVTIGVNAGHGTSGANNYQTYCHPDRTPKVTGGTTASGSLTAVAVSSGMTFYDGTSERDVTLRVAEILRDKLLQHGYNVLMIRDGSDVQLDNVARTVICNNMADCHLAIHFDGDGLSYDKGAFFMSVPDALKSMDPVSYTWEKSENFGWSVIEGLQSAGVAIFGSGNMDMDLTQTSYSTVASIDIELGNAASDHSEAYLDTLAEGLLMGINYYFRQ